MTCMNIVEDRMGVKIGSFFQPPPPPPPSIKKKGGGIFYRLSCVSCFDLVLWNDSNHQIYDFYKSLIFKKQRHRGTL